ncbi:MAG: phosphatase PAP2 family protein [Candidatus Eremiobacteraeota bacterium]|nr:phosphatase PAP2 family protein [Candidatus Eremiobacteraeota bacterium]MBC5820578.1 phosphatase PAP2 family protein [Candidatus Eremiobacteraeota bacterium]
MWWLFALTFFAAFVALGLRVARFPPTPLDVAAVALRGAGTPIAAVFTALGRWWAIVAITLLAASIVVEAHMHVAPVFWLLGSQAASQAIVNGCKRLFRRTRPEGWLLYHEPDLSFPSGHATTAIVMFGELLFLAQRAPALHGPLGIGIDVALSVCIVGIPWSRLVLGAHFATDVIGGVLFGGGWSCATLGIATALHIIRV